MFTLWLIPIFAFFLGSIPFGLLIAKSRGIDIRQHGSGNIGATNVLRIVGKKYGITCFILDFLKGLIPALLGYNLYTFTGADSTMAIDFLRSNAFDLGDNQFKAQSLQVICPANLNPDFLPNFQDHKVCIRCQYGRRIFAPTPSRLRLMETW